MSKVVTMQMVLDVVIKTNGESRKVIRARLRDIVEQAAADGRITGGGPAECTRWDVNVEDQTPKAKPPRYPKKMLDELTWDNPFSLYDKPKNHDQATRDCKAILDAYVKDGDARKCGRSIRALDAQARVGMTDTASREMIEMYLWVALKAKFPKGRHRSECISHVMQAIMDYS